MLIEPGPEEGDRRETCQRCLRVNRVAFGVPDDLWSLVVTGELRNKVICLDCFVHWADFKGINWKCWEMEFYPVSWVESVTEGYAGMTIVETPELAVNFIEALKGVKWEGHEQDKEAAIIELEEGIRRSGKTVWVTDGGEGHQEYEGRDVQGVHTGNLVRDVSRS